MSLKVLRPGGRRAARVVGSTTGGKSWGVISPSDVSLVLWFPGVLPQLDRSTRELELGLDYGTPTMNLAGQSLKFENGQWVAGEWPFWMFCQSGWQKEDSFHSCFVSSRLRD